MSERADVVKAIYHGAFADLDVLTGILHPRWSDVLTFRDGRLVLRRTWPDRAPAIAALGIDNTSVE